jgi:hypothetical protein
VGADAAADCPLHTAAGLAGGKGKERSPKEEGPGIAEGAHSQEVGELQNQGGGGVVALGWGRLMFQEGAPAAAAQSERGLERS